MIVFGGVVIGGVIVVEVCMVEDGVSGMVDVVGECKGVEFNVIGMMGVIGINGGFDGGFVMGGNFVVYGFLVIVFVDNVIVVGYNS